MYLWVGGSSVPNLSPAVSVHRRIASEQMVAKIDVETNHCPKNCPFWLRASTLIVLALFLRTYTPRSHTHDGRALIVELRGIHQMPIWQLRSFFAFDFPAWLLRTAFPAMRALLPSGTKREFEGGGKRLCLL